MPFSVTFASMSLLGGPAQPGNHLADKLANLNGGPVMVTGFVPSDRLHSFVRVSQFGHTK